MRDFIRDDFHPHPPDAAGVVSWVHIGDLHMAAADGQNYADLLAIVRRISEQFAQAISFVFLPGDVADHGAVAEYEHVRRALDALQTPWCAIVGDHDVHEKSFANFLEFMAPTTRYSFRVGSTAFFALNAFDVPDPGSFAVLSDQLAWLTEALDGLPPETRVVLLLHCYPTDLKQGGGALQALVERPEVLLVEMGHTHYNEVANDGRTLYAATRSTGQIEEGPVGFSVTNVDGGIISWRFSPLADDALLMITAPADERLETIYSASASDGTALTVRAKVWSKMPVDTVQATIAGQTAALTRIAASQVWQGRFPASIKDGVHTLTVTGTGPGVEAQDAIHVRVGAAVQPPQRAERDQNNPLAAWPEHGLLGTQLGPNKYGRKW